MHPRKSTLLSGPIPSNAKREIIVNIERDDHGAVEAQRLLVYFEEQLAMHVADRDRLRKELAEISN